jgi:hypothetical protein
MLDNTITLSVDHDRDATPTDEDFTRFEEHINRSLYVGENHSVESRSTLTLTRSMPKVSGNFRGVKKTSAKFTQDLVVDGVDGSTTNVAPLILNLSISVPVGATAADCMHLRERMRAALDHQSIMTRLTESLEI